MSPEPRLHAFAEGVRRCATGRGRLASRAYCVEGERLLARALRAGATLVAAAVCESLAREAGAGIVGELRAAGVEPLVAPSRFFVDLCEGRGSRALGLASLPRAPSWDDLGRAAPACFLACIDVEEPGNVGALVRTAHASGARGFVAVGTTDPFHGKAVRTSMGSVFRLPVVRLRRERFFSEFVSELGVHVLSAVAREGVPLPRVEVPAGVPVAVLIGNEARGLPDAMVAHSHQRVTIPMGSAVDSFSANAAAAVLLYEIYARRQLDRGDCEPMLGGVR